MLFQNIKYCYVFFPSVLLVCLWGPRALLLQYLSEPQMVSGAGGINGKVPSQRQFVLFQGWAEQILWLAADPVVGWLVGCCGVIDICRSNHIHYLLEQY